MLDGIFTIHFAPHHSPTRERRELFLIQPNKTRAAAGATPNTETVAEDIETRCTERILEECQAIHTKLERTLADLPDILTKHAIVQTNLLSLNDLRDGQRAQVLQILGEAKGESDEQSARQIVARAEARVRELEQLSQDMRTSDDNVLRDQDLPTGARGAYNPELGKKKLGRNVKKEEEVDVLRHETGHEILHKLKIAGILSASYFQDTYESLKDLETDGGEKFETLFEELAGESGSVYAVYDKHEIDKSREEVRDLFMEELMTRHADWIASGRKSNNFSSTELKLFAIIDKSPIRSLSDVKEGDGTRRWSTKERYSSAPAGGHDEVHVDEHVDEHGAGEHGEKKEKKERKRTPAELRKAVKETRDRLEAFDEKLAGVENTIRQVVPADKLDEYLDVWRQNRKSIADQTARFEAWTETVETLDRWSGGGLHPYLLAGQLHKQLYPGEKNPEAIDMIWKMYAGTPWDVLNTSQKLEQAQALDLSVITDYIDKQINDVDKAVSKLDDQFNELTTAKEKGSESSWEPGFFSSIQWYSPNHFVTSVKNVFAAFQDAWKQWSQLKEGGLSKAISNATKHLPFGDRAEMSLEQQLDHKDDEVKDEFKKHLEHDIVPFHDLVSGHAFLERNKNDGNRFRGALEYAAEKGWLYDLDIGTGTVLGYRLTPGSTLPRTWSPHKVESYLRELDNKNAKGAESEQERGYTRVKDLSDIQPMIDILDDELARHNYWAIHGIFKRAIEKGKEGETSGWLCTRTMRAIRKDPTAHKHFPIGLMDKLGNIGIETPVWLSTFYKIDRSALASFKKDKVPFEKAGHLANAIHTAEHDIQHAQSEAGLAPLKEKDLDRTVARVLASQTVRLPGWTRPISCFNNKYEDYRKAISGHTTTIKPANADDDFYNIDNRGSEIVLMSRENFREILAIKTTGDLVNPAKSKYFMEQIIGRDEDLKKNFGTGEEWQNFHSETQEKMELVFTSVWHHTQTGGLKDLKIGATNDHTLLELVKRNLIRKEVVQKAKDEKHALATGLMAQIEAAGL